MSLKRSSYKIKKLRDESVVRVAVLGASRVGKTSILTQFLFGRFPATGKYIETIEDLYKHTYTEGIGQISMDIFDTSGSHDYQCFRDRVISQCDGFIIVYSVGERKSFSEMRSLRNYIIKQKKSAKIPIVIVGNKSDVYEKTFMRREAIESIMTMWGHVHRFNTSTSIDSINEIFDTLKNLLRMSTVPRTKCENPFLDGTLFMKSRNSRSKDVWEKVL